MSERKAVRRALVSVYDKSGLIELATGLHEAGVELVSTGSTASKRPCCSGEIGDTPGTVVAAAPLAEHY